MTVFCRDTAKCLNSTQHAVHNIEAASQFSLPLFARKYKHFLAAIAEQDFFALERTRFTRIRYAQCRDCVDGEWPAYRRVEFPACHHKEQSVMQDGTSGSVDVYWALIADMETAISDEVFSVDKGDYLADCDADHSLHEVVTFELHMSDEVPAFVKIVTKCR